MQANVPVTADLSGSRLPKAKGDGSWRKRELEHPFDPGICGDLSGRDLEIPTGVSEPTGQGISRDGVPGGRRFGFQPARAFSNEIATFGEAGAFVLRMAIAEEDRLRCWHLVYKEYLALGYSEAKELEFRYSLHDALPDTGAFFIEAHGQAAGTVTVFPDSPLGLPADEIYREEIDRLRSAGRRPVEVGRLTIEERHKNERSILINLFDVISLYSRCVRGATDLVVTVNPSHEKFYERILLFDKIGELKEFGCVCGAPAVLMRLDLDLQKAVIRGEHGEGPKPEGLAGGRTFYKYFSSDAEERRRVERIQEVHLPPDGAFVRRYFSWFKPLIPRGPSLLHRFLDQCYPGYNLREV